MEARGRDHACLTQVSLWVGGGRAGLLEGTKQTAWASIHAQQEETVTMYTVTVTRSTDLVGDTTEIWEVEPSGSHPASMSA